MSEAIPADGVDPVRSIIVCGANASVEAFRARFGLAPDGGGAPLEGLRFRVAQERLGASRDEATTQLGRFLHKPNTGRRADLICLAQSITQNHVSTVE